MPRVAYRAFFTRGVFSHIEVFRNEIHRAMTNEVAPLVVSDLDEIAADLNLNVRFSTGSVVTSDGITLNVVPVGDGVKIWRWVSYGTKPHVIQVSARSTHRGYKGYRPALLLARYAPRTSPFIRGSYGGPGRYVSAPVYRQRVKHPGITPRYFERSVVYNVRKDYYNIMENALRRAVRKARGSGM